ncbi:hypothetical protein PORCRE_1990 [Porphyromonas crevioricanis JCM 15906]|uniref:Uncharacterized protein n=1 Tax=Porphyromonas crevioricanis JCM 15906 TaxID=1305617 RepID=T1DTL8_9PORP|nr:hypothetical protein PORCRE_1990 [Porphyromonas crevioricanis JCM 15906]GAD06761.1 hypothetical protein PORCAN_368 [Porphyromonas crevioricanis JCM 13913]
MSKGGPFSCLSVAPQEPATSKAKPSQEYIRIIHRILHLTCFL